MSIIVGKFIRSLSADDLHHYFAFRRIEVDAIDWRTENTVLRKSVIGLIGTLPPEDQRTVYLDAEAVFELAGEAGDLAMTDAIGSRAALLEEFEKIDSAEGRALWLFINDSTAFRHACWVRRFDQSREGRSWSGFIAPIGGVYDPSELKLDALADACAEIYRQRAGFQGSVEVERFERLPSWRDEEGVGSISQITIYTEDRPQSRMGWEDENLVRRIHRDASELHLTYCEADGTIDVVAKGGRSVRRKIAGLFARHVLGVDADPDDMAIREIDLSILADRSVLTKNVQGAIAEVELKSVRFQAFDGESPTITYGRRTTSIYDNIEAGRLHTAGYEIDRVELRFTFLPEEGCARGKRVAVALTVPNGCSVKDEGQIHRPAIEEFLKRAGLYRATNDDDQFEAAE